MTMEDRTAVVGVFEHREDADRAVDALRHAGFPDDRIGFAVRGGGDAPEGATDAATAGAGEGAATGLLTGGVIGGLLGAAASGLIPGIGPVLAGGILASVLGGAAVGAAAGGLLGALMGMGVPEEEARYYQGEFEAGRIIVTVRANGRSADARSILDSHGANDVHGGSVRESAATETVVSPGATSDFTSSMEPPRMDPTTGTASMPGHGWDEVSATYRDAWDRQYGESSGRRWQDEEAGYRYGYEMSHDPRYQDREWDEIEPELSSGYSTWSNHYGYRSDDENAWDRIKDTVRSTFTHARHRVA
jgi:hypothetical protein